jgi:hypothetical protein
LPISIYFDNEKDFLKFLGKENEVHSFKSNVEIILREFPELKDWIIKNPKKVIDNANEWQNICKCVNTSNKIQKPNFYIRELPIKVHTKFIERNKSIIRNC